MRFLVRIHPTIKEGNKMTKDTKSIQKLEAYYKKINGESACFYEFHGMRTFEFVINTPNHDDIFEIVNPMFKKFNAAVTFQPIMNFSDLKRSVSKKK